MLIAAMLIGPGPSDSDLSESSCDATRLIPRHRGACVTCVGWCAVGICNAPPVTMSCHSATRHSIFMTLSLC